jgi:hypothetical protein
MNLTRILSATTLAALGQCAGSTSARADVAPVPATICVPGQQDLAAHTPPSVIVDEWGLVDARLDVPVAELSAGPGHPSRRLLARKPVIYIRSASGQPISLSLDVNLPGGTLLESFPAGPTRPSGISWPSIVVAPGACASTLTVPTTCSSRDLFCETPELPTYVTSDANCLDVAGSSTSLLFYRAAISSSALPLSVTRDASGTLFVRTSSLLDASYGIVRISTSSTDDGLVVTHAAPPSGSQTQVFGGIAQTLDPASEIAAIRDHFARLGLTPSEADAFLRAWSVDFFGSAPSRDRRIALPPVRRDFLLYWLPQSTIDAIAPLTISTSAAVHRAWLVRVDLAPRNFDSQ